VVIVHQNVAEKIQKCFNFQGEQVLQVWCMYFAEARPFHNQKRGKEKYFGNKKETQQSTERNHYCSNRLLVDQQPQKYLSVITDGMDQTEPSHVIKTHITGAICHGQKKFKCFMGLLQ